MLSPELDLTRGPAGRPTTRRRRPHDPRGARKAPALGRHRRRCSACWPGRVRGHPGPGRRHALLLQRRRGGGPAATSSAPSASGSRAPSCPAPSRPHRRRRRLRGRLQRREVPVHHVGDPPELFQADIPVVLEGHWSRHGARRRVRRRPHAREARRELRRAKNPDRIHEAEQAAGDADRRSTRAHRRHEPGPRPGRRHPRPGRLVLGMRHAWPCGLLHQRPAWRHLSRTAYACSCCSARSWPWWPWSGRSITRDFSVKYVADNGSTPHAGALQRRHPVGGARGLDPAVGADPRPATSSP